MLVMAQTVGTQLASYQSPDTILLLLAVALIALIFSNTALAKKHNPSYEWWYAAVKIAAYFAMFAISIATTGPFVAVSVLSTYVGMELQKLLIYARDLGIVLHNLFNNNANRSNKQAE